MTPVDGFRIHIGLDNVWFVYPRLDICLSELYLKLNKTIIPFFPHLLLHWPKWTQRYEKAPWNSVHLTDIQRCVRQPLKEREVNVIGDIMVTQYTVDRLRGQEFVSTTLWKERLFWVIKLYSFVHFTIATVTVNWHESLKTKLTPTT